MMRSIRRTLVGRTATGAAAVLSVGGAALVLMMRADLLRQLDESMTNSARLYARCADLERGVSGAGFGGLGAKKFEDSGGIEYLQLWSADGSSAFRSSSLRGSDLARFAAGIDTPEHRWIRLPDGSTGRAVGVRFTPRLGARGANGGEAGPDPGASPRAMTMVLARDSRAIDNVVISLASLAVGVGILTVAIIAFVLRLAIRTSMQPVERLASEIGRLGGEGLWARIDVKDAPAEIEPLRDRLNGLLERIEELFRRERRLGRDVARELGTYLDGLCSTADIALCGIHAPEEYRKALGECLSITRQMQGMVERLSCFLRLERGPIEVRSEEVWPDDFVRACWETVADLAEERRLRVEWDLSAEMPVIIDPDLFGLVVRSILENAVLHSNREGVLSIQTALSEGRIEFRVTHGGCTITQDCAERVFERYGAWSQAGLHCALGLSIVSLAVRALGGSVAVRAVAGGDSEILATVPCAKGMDPECPDGGGEADGRAVALREGMQLGRMWTEGSGRA